MADDTSMLWKYAFVIVFAGAIVALGAHELHNRFVPKRSERVKTTAAELVSDLRGQYDWNNVDPQEHKERERGSFSSFLNKILPEEEE